MIPVRFDKARAAAVNSITMAAMAYSKNARNAFLWLYFSPALNPAISPTMKFNVPNNIIRTKNVITSLVTVSRNAIDATRAVSNTPSIILSNISVTVPVACNCP